MLTRSCSAAATATTANISKTINKKASTGNKDTTNTTSSSPSSAAAGGAVGTQATVGADAQTVDLGLIQPSFGSSTVMRKLGSGTFAKVYLVESRAGRKVAAKIPSDKIAAAVAQRELTLGLSLLHPHLVRTLGSVSLLDGRLAILLEYMPGGDLFDVLVPGRGMPMKQAQAVLRQVVSGVAYMHALGLVHRDIKPENVLLTRNGLAKLCDFGMVKPIGYHGPSQGTMPYAAPEILQPRAAAMPAQDMWALGVLFFVMMCGDFPWLQARLQDANFAEFVHQRHLKPSHDLWGPLHARTLKVLLPCLAIAPEERCSARHFLQQLEAPLPAARLRSSCARHRATSDAVLLSSTPSSSSASSTASAVATSP